MEARFTDHYAVPFGYSHAVIKLLNRRLAGEGVSRIEVDVRVDGFT